MTVANGPGTSRPYGLTLVRGLLVVAGATPGLL
jgi:hypothetical protein